jgi:hypothetical protein
MSFPKADADLRLSFFFSASQKIPEPAYFGPIFGGYGIPWFGTTGTFLDTNPYANRVGNQGGYLLSFPQVTLFQDYNSSPTHELSATFDVGMSYDLTIGVFGKGTLAPGSTLALSLYYLDDQNNRVTVGSTTVTYSPVNFPTTPPLNLVDYSVNVPAVQANDPWAGKHIGIQLESTTPLQMATGGNWDFDNVRLQSVPEPGTMALGAIGIAVLFFAHRRARQ